MSNNALIKNYAELKAVKHELKDRIHQTESKYIEENQWIRSFLDLSGAHNNTSNPGARKNLHAAILQSVAEYLRELDFFKKQKKEYNEIVLPFALTLISVIVARKL